MLLLKDWKELLSEVADMQSLLGSLNHNAYFNNFKACLFVERCRRIASHHHPQDTLQRWEHHLGTFNACVLLLNEIQRKWVYLEPVFARGALPAEQARFCTASDAFVGVLRELEASPRLTRLRDIPRLQVCLLTQFGCSNMAAHQRVAGPGNTDAVQSAAGLVPKGAVAVFGGQAAGVSALLLCGGRRPSGAAGTAKARAHGAAAAAQALCWWVGICASHVHNSPFYKTICSTIDHTKAICSVALYHSHEDRTLHTLAHHSGVAAVQVVDGCVSHVCSAEGEILPLLAPLPMTDAAEQWLADLARALRVTLQVLLLHVTRQQPLDKTPGWPVAHP